jgi:uncharacterized alkaline shock family protein YloU
VSVSTATRAAAPPTVPAPPDGFAGAIVIADTVVAKLAARATLGIPNAGGATPRILGQALPGAGHLQIRESSLDTMPQASADVDGSVAFIDLSISVRWPASVAQVTAQVRDHVASRVQELTGLTVAQVRIAVTALVTDTVPLRVR